LDLATLTALLVRVFLVITMLSIGLRLTGDRAPERSIRIPTLILVFAANLVLVPILGMATAIWAGLSGAIAIAFLATVVAPGGSLGPKLVQIARGDLAFGVLLTFGLSVLATLTVAPSLELASRASGLDPQAAALDPVAVILSLAIFQLAPTLAGLAIAQSRRSFAERIVGPLTAVSTALIVGIAIVAIADTYDEALALGPAPIVAMVVIASVACAIGWIIGGSSPATRRASALVTGQRAPGLALLLVAGPGHALETATVVAFTLVLLIVNGGLAFALGRPWSRTSATWRSRPVTP
jgi:predicted Na+-dependent transporter